MHGAHVVSQIINLGAMEPIKGVNLNLMFLRQKNPSQHQYACVKKQRTRRTAMVLMLDRGFDILFKNKLIQKDPRIVSVS